MEINNILILTIKLSLSLTLVWGLWFAFLRNMNRFALVRTFLLTGIIFSLLLPLLIPLIQSKKIVPLTNFGFEPSFLIQGVTIGIQESSINWINIIFIIYLSISMLFLFRIVMQIFKIVLLAKGNVKYKKEGIYIIEHSKRISPFSFMNYCFINPSQIPGNKIEGVIAHERAHYTKMHSIDIMLMELVGLSQWFNPFYWMLRKAIVEIHEYQADSTAIQSQTDTYAYLDSIVSIAFCGVALPIGNNFNKSLTLKRLAMINISPKNKRVILRLSISLLVSVPIIIAISCESGVLPTEDTDIVSIEATVEKSTTSVEDQVFVMVEEMAGFDGGNSNKFREYIASNLIYPKEAAEHGIQGRVFISFIVEADGSVSNVDVVRGVHTLLDNEAIRVVESSPRWTPGRQRGVAVRQSLTFPIIFTLE